MYLNKKLTIFYQIKELLTLIEIVAFKVIYMYLQINVRKKTY